MAHAAIAGAPSVTTTGLDLRTTTITRYDRNGGVPSQAEWCFSQPLTGTIGSAGGTGSGHTFIPGTGGRGLSLVGYASTQVVYPDVAFVDPNNINCVIGNFGATENGFPTQVRAFTIGSAFAGVVTTNSGLSNHTDSVPLAPSDATGPLGRTTGPNILGVQADQANNQIVYTLDHDLAALNPTPVAANFFYIDTSGVEHDGTGGVSISNNVIRVNFAGLGANAVIAEIGMKKGAVGAADGAFDGVTPQTTPGEPNQIETVIGPAGGTNANPILIAAAVVTVNGNQTTSVDYTFDKQVNIASVNTAKFHLYSVNDRGDFVGTGPASQPNNPNVVRVTFPSLDLSQIVRTGVDAGAVTGTAPAGPNIISTAPLNPSASAPGFTSGPDVTQATRAVNGPPSNSNSVLVTFDSAVQVGGGASGLAAANFHLIGPSGNDLGAASNVSPVGSNQVVVLFSNTGSVSASVGIAVQPTVTATNQPPDVTTAGSNDPVVEQTAAYVAGGSGQRLSIARTHGIVLKHAKKHPKKKHHKKHHHGKKHHAKKH